MILGITIYSIIVVIYVGIGRYVLLTRLLMITSWQSTYTTTALLIVDRFAYYAGLK